MPLIRDTIDPTRERVVSDEEALDLERMGLLLTGTRARTPDGLRAAAIRQSQQVEADTFAAELASRAVTLPADEPADDADDPEPGSPDEEDEDQVLEQSPGADPVSTTDDPATPTTQES